MNELKIYSKIRKEAIFDVKYRPFPVQELQAGKLPSYLRLVPMLVYLHADLLPVHSPQIYDHLLQAISVRLVCPYS